MVGKTDVAKSSISSKEAVWRSTQNLADHRLLIMLRKRLRLKKIEEEEVEEEKEVMVITVIVMLK